MQLSNNRAVTRHTKDYFNKTWFEYTGWILSSKQLLKSCASYEWPLLLESTTDLLRTTVKLPLCVDYTPLSWKLLCHSPHFLHLITVLFSPPLLSSPQFDNFCNKWRFGSIVGGGGFCNVMLFVNYSLSAVGDGVRMCNLFSESCNTFAVIFSFIGYTICSCQYSIV